MSKVKEESFGIIPLQKKGEKWSVFIILQHHGKHWGFPKGKPLSKESPQQSAKRELLEETGLEIVRFLKEEPFVEEYTVIRSQEKVEKKVYYFPALVRGDFILQLKEVQEGKWVKLEEAKALLTFEEAKAICQKIQDFLHGL